MFCSGCKTICRQENKIPVLRLLSVWLKSGWSVIHTFFHLIYACRMTLWIRIYLFSSQLWRLIFALVQVLYIICLICTYSLYSSYVPMWNLIQALFSGKWVTVTSLLQCTIVLPENRFPLQFPFLSFVTVPKKVGQINRLELKKKLRLWNGFKYTLVNL